MTGPEICKVLGLLLIHLEAVPSRHATSGYMHGLDDLKCESLVNATVNTDFLQLQAQTTSLQLCLLAQTRKLLGHHQTPSTNLV